MGKLEIPSPLFFNAVAVKGLEPETGFSRDRIPSRIILDVRTERQAGLAIFPSSLFPLLPRALSERPVPRAEADILILSQLDSRFSNVNPMSQIGLTTPMQQNYK